MNWTKVSISATTCRGVTSDCGGVAVRGAMSRNGVNRVLQRLAVLDSRTRRNQNQNPGFRLALACCQPKRAIIFWFRFLVVRESNTA